MGGKGTFMTIDRPYGPVLDFLHHRIGPTHVAHHVAHTWAHYHAKEATEALATAFPHIYLYAPTPLHKALWRVSRDCVAVHQHDDQYVFHPTDKPSRRRKRRPRRGRRVGPRVVPAA